MDTYTDNEFEPWARGIRSVAATIAQQPMLRAVAADRAQRSELVRAQMATEAAQGRKYNAEAGLDEDSLAAARELQQAVNSGAITQTEDGWMHVSPEFQGTMAGAIMRMNPRAAGTQFGAFSKAQNQRVSEREAQNSQNKRTRMTLQSREKMARETPWNVPQGGKAVNRETGELIARGDVTLSPGDERFIGEDLAPGTLASAVAAGREAPPKSSMAEGVRARTLGQLLVARDTALAKAQQGGEFSGVDTNAVARAQQARDVARSEFDQATTNNVSAGAQQPRKPQYKTNGTAPDGEPLVDVINPQGQPKRLRQSQVEEALRSGYKITQ